MSRQRTLALMVTSAVAFVAAGAVPACIASGPPIDPITNEDAGGFGQGGDGGSSVPIDVPTTDPHAVIGAQPSHGPFTGGDRVVIRGNGFASDVRVWFGEVEATDIVPIDATRLQVSAPPNERGATDLTTQNGDDESTRRTLNGGYHYDALYADPSTGPISGGTEITIYGQGTHWDASSEAFVDDEPCATIDVVDETTILCTVPKGTQGAKPVRVEGGEETITVLDAYTYEDSSDGFKGGLSGDPLAGELRVLVYNNFTGDAIPAANVIVGSSLETGIVTQTDMSGVATITSDELDEPVTVSIGALCHSPISFVDVPVDTVTVYLDPILTPACASGGDPPGVGGKQSETGIIEGEIVFPSNDEFKRGSFLVPEPIGNEQIVAYLLPASPTPLTTFVLPPPSNAITPNTDGTIGYEFAAATVPGNRTYYVLAGLEDRTRTPATFIAYSMGVVRGVPVLGGETTSEVYVPMVPLDLALTIAPSPPPPGPSGPDRLLTTVTIRLGADGFASLPTGQQAPFLPISGDVEFVGLPLLSDSFSGSTYFASSRAVTGATFVAPMSVVSSVQTNTTAFPVVMDGFVGLPHLVDPALNASWDGTHLETTFGPGAPVDLTVYDIISGNGLVHWMVAVPGGARAVELPNMRALPNTGLPSGTVNVGVYGARIDDFDYAELRYRHLRPVGMTAYSLDYVQAHLP